MWASTRGLANLVSRCIILRPAPFPPLSFSFCLFKPPSERSISLPSATDIENTSLSRLLAPPLTTPFLVNLYASLCSSYQNPSTYGVSKKPKTKAISDLRSARKYVLRNFAKQFIYRARDYWYYICEQYYIGLHKRYMC
jgi:hypothetical protein